MSRSAAIAAIEKYFDAGGFGPGWTG